MDRKTLIRLARTGLGSQQVWSVSEKYGLTNNRQLSLDWGQSNGDWPLIFWWFCQYSVYDIGKM